MRKIWDGKGEVGDQAYFQKFDETLVGRAYVRVRVNRYLLRMGLTLVQRKAVLARTVDNDAWLAGRHGMLVTAVCRDAHEEHYR